MPTTYAAYIGALRTGSQAGPGAVIAVATSAFPRHSSSGPGSLPVPTAQILQGGTKGTVYSETISAQGGISPYTFSVISGSLPTSLSLNSGTGVISGTPSATGTFNFTIQATDANGSTGSTAFEIIISSPAAGANSGFIG